MQRYMLAMVMVVLSITLVGLAQNDPDPRDRSIEDVRGELERLRDDRPAIDPVAEEKLRTKPAADAPPQVQTLTGVAPQAKRGGKVVRKDSSLVTAMQGRMLRGTGDAINRWIFSFDGDSANLDDPPVYLLPCAELEAMEKSIREHGEDAAIIVTGEIFSYHGDNYLLVRQHQVTGSRGNLGR